MATVLESVRALSDDIVVYDSGSTDRTPAIAADRGITPHHGPWLGFGATRRAATELARHDWVLCVDAELRAKTFPTPLENDHVRFSWLVTVAQLALLLLWRGAGRVRRWAIGGLFGFLAVYLHVLSARTGLGAFYLLLLAAAMHLVLQKRSATRAAAIVAVAVLVPLLAWQALPSFRNRVHYIRYDMQYVLSGTYQPGANDGNRFLSIRCGIDLLKQHPGGIGFGDIPSASHAWFDAQVPGMIRSDRFLPSSEWLMYGLGAGWIGVLLFTVAMALPFFERNVRGRFLWNVLNCGAAFSFLFDIGLEVQYGVYLYVFLVLWWWKWLAPQTGPGQYASEAVDRDHL